MLLAMRPEDEHAFRADDPVARYWLHNSIGFSVRGLRGGGVVKEVGLGVDGVEVLAVRSLGRTTMVSAARVESVDPWDETIVLGSHSRERRGERIDQANRAARATGRTARTAALVAAAATARFLALVASLLLALAALLRRHAPGARDRAGRLAATLAAIGGAYAAEAARAYREQRRALNAWREGRRNAAWGDDSPITRAGADDADARSEEEVRSRPSTRVDR